MNILGVRIALICSLGLTAVACASPRAEAEKAIVNPLERFPLTAHDEADETRLAVHPGGLSSNQAAALAGVADRWRDAGGDVLTLTVPERGPQEMAARAMAEQARNTLMQDGVDPRAIRIGGYDSAGDAAAPIVASFASIAADVPQCGKSWDNLSGTQSNNNQSNFGCAVAANMAAQIANPADINGPQAMTPSDAGRRAAVIQNYRKGAVTSAAIDPNGSGAVSKAIP